MYYINAEKRYPTILTLTNRILVAIYIYICICIIYFYFYICVFVHFNKYNVGLYFGEILSICIEKVR